MKNTLIREFQKNRIDTFIAEYKNSKSIMKENEKGIKEIIEYCSCHTAEDFHREYPNCTYTISELKYYLKQIRKSLREL